MSLIKYLGRRALLNVIIIINIYSFNLGAYKKMLIIHTLEQIKYFIIYHTQCGADGRNHFCKSRESFSCLSAIIIFPSKKEKDSISTK